MEIIEFSRREKINRIDVMTIQDLACRIVRKSNELGLKGLEILRVTERFNDKTEYYELILEARKSNQLTKTQSLLDEAVVVIGNLNKIITDHRKMCEPEKYGNLCCNCEDVINKLTENFLQKIAQDKGEQG